MKSMGNYIGNFRFSNVYSNAFNRKGQFRVNVRINKGKLHFELSHMYVHVTSLRAKPNDKKVEKKNFLTYPRYSILRTDSKKRR